MSEVLKLKCDWIKCNDNSVQDTFPSRERDCHVGKKRAMPGMLAQAMPRRILANNKMLL